MATEDGAFLEQLNGLVDLLNAVGINSNTVDNREMKRASWALKKQGSGAPMVFPSEMAESKELNDDQIEAMIVKLQQAQAQAPQLMEALEEYAEQRNGGGGGGKGATTKKRPKKKGGAKVASMPGADQQAAFVQAYQKQTRQKMKYHNQHHQPGHHHQQQGHGQGKQQQQQQQQDDHDDFDEDEEDDEFDEDADYPMVGHGISDDISVVSDMTTPTVISAIHINEEERYSDMLPSMYVPGGAGAPPMVIQPPKRKNLVAKVGAQQQQQQQQQQRALPGVPMQIGSPPTAINAVGGVGISRPGGAAAKRRQTYQQTMSRLHQNPYGVNMVGPAANHNLTNAQIIQEDLFAAAPVNAAAAVAAVPTMPTMPSMPAMPAVPAMPQPRGKAPHRTPSGNVIRRASERHMVPSRSKSSGGNPFAGSLGGDLNGDSFHTTPDNWMPFEDASVNSAASGALKKNKKGSGSSSVDGGISRPKKKGSKKPSTISGQSRSSSPKGKKKPVVGSTTIDRDGFLVRGGADPSGSGSVDGGEKVKKKAVKKKVIKRPTGSSGASASGEPVKPKKTTPGRSASGRRRMSTQT